MSQTLIFKDCRVFIHTANLNFMTNVKQEFNLQLFIAALFMFPIFGAPD